MGRLKGKVVLVVGSTMGIGRAIAVGAAAEGAKVVVTGRTEAAGLEVANVIEAAGGEAIYVRVDVTEAETIAAAVRAAVEHFGRLDGMVNNVAGMTLNRIDQRVTELELDDWNLILATDLTSAFLGMKHGIRAMLEGGHGGSVVNIASEAGIRGMNGLEGYTASKGAMVAMTRSVASYYSRYDVRCNCLAVGFVNTGGERIEELLRDPVFAGEIMRHHLGHIGKPEEVAAAAVFLLSDESAYVSGAIIPVDAGATSASHIVRPSAPDIPGFPRLRPGAPAF
jgi:NAD(P)-dependent dehydrogenase (short-subunit alcohol dehydrogenase family)